MAKQVECIKEMTQIDFEKKYLCRKTPVVIISGLDWSAFKWTPNYFKQLFPNKTVYLESYYYTKINDKESIKATNIDKLSMQEAIELIFSNKKSNVKYYLSQKSIYPEFPELMQDFTKPIWMSKEPSETNLWFGEAGNATPLHFDFAHNFLVQIYGRKYIRLFAPEDTKNLYQHTLDTKGPPHLSQIFDIDNCDYEKFPNFKYAKAYEVTLLPGETLFIPAGWWHDVRSLDHAISINFWWRPKINECTISQIIPIAVYKLFEINKFNDMYNFFPEFKDFNNDFEAAQYCLKQKFYWLAVLFIANFTIDKLRSIAILLNIKPPSHNIFLDIQSINQYIFAINKKLSLTNDVLFLLFNLIDKSKSEDNNILEKKELMIMLKYVDNFSKNINTHLIKENYNQHTLEKI